MMTENRAFLPKVLRLDKDTDAKSEETQKESENDSEHKVNQPVKKHAACFQASHVSRY